MRVSFVLFRRRRRSLTRGVVCDVCVSIYGYRPCMIYPGRGKNKTHFDPTEIVETRIILCYKL